MNANMAVYRTHYYISKIYAFISRMCFAFMWNIVSECKIGLAKEGQGFLHFIKLCSFTTTYCIVPSLISLHISFILHKYEHNQNIYILCFALMFSV